MLHNFHDFSYSAPLVIGSPQPQLVEVVYDTGSDWLTVEGATCHACEGNTFQHQESTSFKFLETAQSTQLAYGSATLQGLRASDKVCLPASNDLDAICLPQFEFFLVSE